MRRKLLVKRKNRRRQESLIEARGAFTRLKNRSARHRPEDFDKAGYPMVEYKGRDWAEMHRACKELFVTKQGWSTYTWFGHRFYFLTDEDADVFRALQYIV